MIKIILAKLIPFVFISAVIYFAIAGVLIIFGKTKKPDPVQQSMAFNELFFDWVWLLDLKYDSS